MIENVFPLIWTGTIQEVIRPNHSASFHTSCLGLGAKKNACIIIEKYATENVSLCLQDGNL